MKMFCSLIILHLLFGSKWNANFDLAYFVKQYLLLIQLPGWYFLAYGFVAWPWIKKLFRLMALLKRKAGRNDSFFSPSIAILVEKNAYLSIFSLPSTAELGQALPSPRSIYLWRGEVSGQNVSFFPRWPRPVSATAPGGVSFTICFAHESDMARTLIC